MKIGFDAKKIVRNLTGIGNYSRGVINALTSQEELAGSNRYILFAPHKENKDCLQRLHPSPDVSFIRPPYQTGVWQEWWRCRGIVKDIRSNGIDVFHGLNNELPWGIEKAGCKSVVTIHDLIFLRYPETYDRVSRLILKAKTLHACQCADKIIAISQQTRQDIMEFYRIPAEKIEVVYQGCDNIFKQEVSPEARRAVRERYGIPDRYLLNVGTLELRKNHATLVKALAELDDDIHLVLVGKPTPQSPSITRYIQQLGLQHRVHLLHDVPNNDLPALYQGCTVFLYLSYFEGFGIPVLEAINSGVPVIAATGSSLNEAGGPSVTYCHPFDHLEVAHALSDLLNNSGKARQKAEEGKLYARRFSDRQIATDLIRVYQEILAH